MGQTLTHGVYLPDEGERNCYSGLASNWSILDGAVGTIAEHTSALAGKAPLVHTHTKSDITDFPAYGNAAGTICEGNDARLSDARTPVAHTHGKADITDLFNSANTWSGENTFSAPCKTLGKKLLTDITDLDDAYYNGEVCGFNPNTLHNPTGNYGNVLTINNAVNIPDNIYSSWITQIAATASGGYLGVRNRSNGGAWTSWTRILTEDHAVPTVTNTYDLGSSSYKWKTLNGINPGALSFPSGNAVTGNSNTQLQDISGDLVQDQYLNCYFTPRMDGWAYIALDCSNATIRSGCSSFSIMAKTARAFANALYTRAFTKTESAWSKLVIFFPVTANNEITLECTFTGFSVDKGYIIPCLGNV